MIREIANFGVGSALKRARTSGDSTGSPSAPSAVTKYVGSAEDKSACGFSASYVVNGAGITFNSTFRSPDFPYLHWMVNGESLGSFPQDNRITAEAREAIYPTNPWGTTAELKLTAYNFMFVNGACQVRQISFTETMELQEAGV